MDFSVLTYILCKKLYRLFSITRRQNNLDELDSIATNAASYKSDLDMLIQINPTRMATAFFYDLNWNSFLFSTICLIILI